MSFETTFDPNRIRFEAPREAPVAGPQVPNDGLIVRAAALLARIRADDAARAAAAAAPINAVMARLSANDVLNIFAQRDAERNARIAAEAAPLGAVLARMDAADALNLDARAANARAAAAHDVFLAAADAADANPTNPDYATAAAIAGNNLVALTNNFPDDDAPFIHYSGIESRAAFYAARAAYINDLRPGPP